MLKIGSFEYSHLGKVFEASYAFEQTNQRKPVILIFHAWRGKDEFVYEKAKYLASLGYLAVAIDLYGKGVIGKTEEQCIQLMSPLIENRHLIQERTNLAIQEIKKLEQADITRLAAIGFCFGGLCALDMARQLQNIKGVVSFHGLLLPLEKTHRIKSKILVFHGYKDPMVTSRDLENFEKEMMQSEADFQITIYGQAYHAFTNPIANSPEKGTVYDEASCKRAILAMKNFFDELFT